MSLLNGGKASWSILNTSGENQCFHVSRNFTSFTKPLLLHYGYYAARLILTLRSVIEKARAKPVGVQRHFSSSSPSRKKKQEDNVVGFPTTKSSGILAGTTILVLFLSRVMSNSSSSAFFFVFCVTLLFGTVPVRTATVLVHWLTRCSNAGCTSCEGRSCSSSLAHCAVDPDSKRKGAEPDACYVHVRV